MSKKIDNVCKVTYNDGIIVTDYYEHLTDPEDNRKSARKITKQIIDLIELHKNEKVKILVDLTKVTKAVSLPMESRKVYARLAKLPKIYRVALIGGNLRMRVIINFIVKLVRKSKKFRWFDSKQKAIKWLKSH